MKYIIATILMMMSLPAVAEEETIKIMCGEPEKVEKILNDKGYHHLLDMKNENGVGEQLWSGGRDMIIAAEKDKNLCLMSTATDVVFNPRTIKKIMEIWDKSHPPT